MKVGETGRRLGERISAAVGPKLRWLPGPGFSGPDHIDPVFIVGSGRSGTTLLRRMLMQGGQIHIPPESYVLGTVIKRYGIWRLAPWRSTVRHVLSEFESYPEFALFDVSLRPVESALIETPPSSRNLATIIDAIYRFHSREKGSGANRWGDKTPLNAYCLPDIRLVFPAARFVHMLRDGCDVVSSMIDMGRYATVEEAARRWNTSIDAVGRFAQVHADSVLEIRYEDLATHPEATMRAVCTWLGLDYRDDMVTSASSAPDLGDVPTLGHHRQVLAPITTSSIGRGRRGLDDAERRQLQRLLGANLASTGYAAVFPSTPATETTD
jgi:hypothetical protein